MKYIALIAALLFSAIQTRAETEIAITAAAVSSSLRTVSTIVRYITLTSTTTNTTIARFYDTSTTNTSIVRPSYSNYTSYATNFSTIFTNEAGILVTNSFVGTYTGPTTVSAVTNSRPVYRTVVVPGNSTRTVTVNGQTIHGLAVITTEDAIVELEYDRTQ